MLGVTFGTNWDGGDVTLTGVDQFGDPVVEVLTGGEGTRKTQACFASISAASKSAVGVDAATASIGTQNLLGLGVHVAGSDDSSANGLVFEDGIATAISTFWIASDDSEDQPNSVEPGNAPNGSRVYQVIVTTI